MMEEMNWSSFFILSILPLGMILFLGASIYGNHLIKQEEKEKKQH
jgi:hypothetical protein